MYPIPILSPFLSYMPRFLNLQIFLIAERVSVRQLLRVVFSRYAYAYVRTCPSRLRMSISHTYGMARLRMSISHA